MFFPVRKSFTVIQKTDTIMAQHILNSKWEGTILNQRADDTHKLLYDFHFFMHAIFIHVAPKDLNFTTVSTDFITYIFSAILSFILLKRYTKNPLFSET